MRDTLLVGLVSVACGIALFRPIFGIFAFTFLGFFNPHTYAWSFATTLPLSQIVAISTIVGTLLSPERKILPMQRETLLLIALWLFFAFSTVVAIRPVAALESLQYTSKVFLMIFVTMLLIKSEANLLWLIRIIGLSLGFYGLKGGVFAIVTRGGEMVYGPENSFLFANNSIGLALAMNIPILLFLLKRESSWCLRWIIRGMLVFSYPAIICTFSRGAWLGMAVVTGVAILKSKHKFVAVATVGIVAVILQIAAPQILSSRIEKRFDSLVEYEEDSSAQARFWNWEFCRRVAMARPLTGAGFSYYSSETYAEYYPEFQQRWPGKVWSCHSTWLSIFSEHGFPGFMLWLGLLIACFMSIRRMRFYSRYVPQRAHLVDYADMLQTSIVAYLVVGTFLDAPYFDMFYYLVALIIIIKQVVPVEGLNLPAVAHGTNLRLPAAIVSPAGKAVQLKSLC